YKTADPLTVMSGQPMSEGDVYKRYYQRGLDALLASQWWRLNRLDLAKLEEGIHDLEESKRLAQAAQDNGYTAACSFYLGKAYFKKKAFGQARPQLEEFIRRSGVSRVFEKEIDEATEMLQAMVRYERTRL